MVDETNHHYDHVNRPGSFLAGTGAMLLMAKQSGNKTREQIQLT